MAKLSPPNSSNRITNFFSPSPRKNKRTIDALEGENQENGTVKKANHANSGPHGGTPFLPHSYKGETLCVEPVEILFGLQRIAIASEPLKSLSAKQGEAKPLSVGSILGRNLSANSVIARRNRNNKIDLQIWMENGGCCISRKQLEIKRMNTSSITIQQPKNVVNETVHIIKYNAITKTMSRSPVRLKRGSSVELVPGDVIEFDGLSIINDKPTRNPKPLHVFRLVRLKPFSNKKKAPALSLTASTNTIMVDLCASSESQQNMSEVLTQMRNSPKNLMARLDLIGSPSTLHNSTPKVESLRQDKIVVDLCACSVSQEEIPVDARHATTRTGACSGTNGSQCLSSATKPGVASLRKNLSSHTQRVASAVRKFEVNPTLKSSRFNAISVSTGSLRSEERKQSRSDHIPTPVLFHAEMDAPKSIKVLKTDWDTDKVLPTQNRLNASLSGHADDTKLVNAPIICDIFAENTIKPIPIPKPNSGDLFRVKMKCVDIFERKVDQWFFGEADNVSRRNGKRSTYKVTLKFEDNSTELYDYPAGDNSIQQIELDNEGTCARKVVFDSSTGERSKGEIVYELNPTMLYVGDLVDAKYQDGMGSPHDGKWFRGRIAEVNSHTNTAVVAYFDGDIEYGVPMGSTKIRLISRGYDDMCWLESVRVDTTRGKGAKKTPKGTISTIENDGRAVCQRDLKVKVVFADGRHKMFLFVKIVKWLFADYVESVLPINKILWPFEKVIDSSEMKTTTTENRTTSADEGENDFSEPERKQYHVRRVADPIALSCMHPSLGNSFFRALDASEPHIGELFLAHMATLHRRGPTSKNGHDLLTLLLNGPRSEGTLFPDPNRVDHAKKYVHLMMSSSCTAQALIDSLPISSWKDLCGCLLQLKDRAYQVAGDEISTNKVALQRVQHSLQVAAASAEFFGSIFEYELKDFVSSEKKEHKTSYRCGKLVKALLENPDGVRDSLKMVTRIYITAWIECSHFVLSDPATSNRKTRMTNEYTEYESLPAYIKDNCFNNATKLMESLGKILSYVAWVFCEEQSVGMNDVNLAADIKNIVTSEIDHTNFDPCPFLAEAGKAIKTRPNYCKELKKEIVFNLDYTFAGKLQVNLAKKLNIGQDYAQITEW